jgi:Zn-dependent M28 family amino/carboxypeptidase
MRTSSSCFCSAFIILMLVWCTAADAQTQDRTVRALMDSVSQERLREHIDMLQKAGGHWSRVTFTPGNDSAVRYVADRFREIPGLSSVILDTFSIAAADTPYNTRPVYNVIATINGNTDPETKVVVGAHIDCSASKMGAAVWHNQWNTMRVPGADDNASGIAAVLELARIMAAPDFVNSVRNTVVFIAFGAEESGLVHRSIWSAVRGMPNRQNNGMRGSLVCFRSI